MICGACGRVLKNPDSKKTGYGPVCYKKMFGSPPPKKKESKGKRTDESEGIHDFVIPGQMEISDFLSSE